MRKPKRYELKSQLYTLADLAKSASVSYQTLRSRLAAGCPTEIALSLPARSRSACGRLGKLKSTWNT